MYKNSLKIYEITCYLKSFWLWSFISVIFLKFVWLNDIDIWIFHLIMWALVFFLEIPTWSFADKFWYKKSISLSLLFLCLAFVWLLSAMFFWKYTIFLVAWVFFSLNYAFSSWAQNSYVYTIFKHEKKEKDYIKFQSKISRNTKIFEWIAIIFWAYLYTFAEYLPYLIQFLLVFWAFILSLFMKDEPVHRKWDKLEWDIKSSFKIFFSQKIFIFLLIFTVLTIIPKEYFHNVMNQSLFLELWMSVQQIGIIWAVSYFLSWFLINTVPYVREKFWVFYSYLIMVFLTPLVWASFLFSNWIVSIILISSFLYFINDAKSIFWDNYIQSVIKNDKQRATIQSIFSMISILPIKIMFVVFGLVFVWVWYVDLFAILSLVFWFLSLIFLVFFLRKEFLK